MTDTLLDANVRCKIIPDEDCIEGYVAVMLYVRGGSRVVRVLEKDVVRVDDDHTISGTQDTSRLAALKARPKSGTNRALILGWLEARGQYGATDEEIQQVLGMSPNSQRPRRVELVKGGWVVDSGRTRLTDSGNEATVWVAAEESDDE